MSPYENRLNLEDFRRIGLIACVKPGQSSALETAIKRLSGSSDPFKETASIRNLNIFRRVIGKSELLFVYFETSELDQEKAIGVFSASSPLLNEIENNLEPWTRAEFMNVIAVDTEPNRNMGKQSGLVSELVPERELSYRSLHQTNWPGVIDQMRRSNYRNWTTFLTEWKGALLLFTYVEYIGEDQAADDAAMGIDPVTLRWWSHTQPCIRSVDSGGSAWSKMVRI